MCLVLLTVWSFWGLGWGEHFLSPHMRPPESSEERDHLEVTRVPAPQRF